MSEVPPYCFFARERMGACLSEGEVGVGFREEQQHQLCLDSLCVTLQGIFALCHPARRDSLCVTLHGPGGAFRLYLRFDSRCVTLQGPGGALRLYLKI